MTLEELDALHNGETSLIDWIEQYCNRVEQEDKNILAMVGNTYHRDRILSDAQRLQDRHSPKHPLPLYGMTVGVKDIIHCDGFETLCGSTVPPHFFAGEQASCITRLLSAGAIIMGKTHTTEFAAHDPAPTRNPHNANHTPGGSSSGSAAGLVRDFFTFSLGSQTGGSVIRPAAYCGVIGFKPTFDRIPIDGVVPFAKTVDHLGFFCKEVSLLSVLSSVLLNQWDATVILEKDQLRFGIPEGPYLQQTTPHGDTQFRKAVDHLRLQGVAIQPYDALSNIQDINGTHRPLMVAEMARVHQIPYEQYQDRYRPQTLEMIEQGRAIDDPQYDSLLHQRLKNIDSLTSELASHPIDFWITPSTMDHADKGMGHTGNPIMNYPWTHTGMPAISLPSGFDEIGLPHGLQIVGQPGSDERLVQAAEYLFEKLPF